MSGHPLPDEIISEILSPALKVSSEAFCDNSEVSPFAKYSESTSAYLLVCKSWLRVATPLLYNIVVLRSKAQAKALSVALAGNGQLGQFIKKLRVEGGYGPPMHIILKFSPNISDLFLSLEIYSSDSTNGLCKGLPLINPTRLILRDLDYKPLTNKIVSQLLEALVGAMSKWDHLCVFDCPYTDETERTNKVFGPLLKSQRLHTLSILSANCIPWAYSAFKGCPLKTIYIKRPVASWERFQLPFEKDPVLTALLKYTERVVVGKAKAEEPIVEPSLITPSLNPSFVPMAGVSKEVREQVWARVLYFAMSVPELASNPTADNIPLRLPLLLVSKTFNRLGLYHYYGHVQLKRHSAILHFNSVLARNSSIGPCVRSLGFGYYLEMDISTDESLSRILSQTSRLARFGDHKSFTGDLYPVRPTALISWDAFEAMAESSGSTLRECHVHIAASQNASANIFNNFAALQTLVWNSSATLIDIAVDAGGLLNLEALWILSATQSFFIVLSRMRLKSLRSFVLSTQPGSFEPSLETFLNVHGPKLTELELPYSRLRTLSVKILEHCPNLHFISLSGRASMDTPPAADGLYSSQTVQSLAKIILNIPYWTRDKVRIVEWETFFFKFQPKCLPNLREIEVKCCAWPTNERDIPKSCWVRWAEVLLERNINLLDKTGTKWRPRLKVK